MYTLCFEAKSHFPKKPHVATTQEEKNQTKSLENKSIKEDHFPVIELSKNTYFQVTPQIHIAAHHFSLSPPENFHS